MHSNDTKTVFIGLLGEPTVSDDEYEATIYLSGILLHQAWAAFQQFMIIPIESADLYQGYIFEVGIYPEEAHDEFEQFFYVTFRRYFFLPLEDDPDGLVHLCFECSLLYPPSEALAAWRTWLQIEVGDDVDLAAQAFVARVGAFGELWHRLTDTNPVQTYIFQ